MEIGGIPLAVSRKYKDGSEPRIKLLSSP